MNKSVALGLGTLVALTLASCGGGGSLTQDLGTVLGDFQILNLTTGAVESRAAVVDLGTNPDYRTTKIVFRAVDTGSITLGTAPTAFGAQADETPTSVSVPRFYIGVFEVTRAQWEALDATTPWTTFSAGLVGTDADDKPASGMTRDAVTARLLSWNGVHQADLALPSESQWEIACRGGATTTFAWGEDRSDAVVGSFAVVSETAGGVAGPRAVGGRTANAFGLFDMHGNVWEFTATDSIRGGSWRDSLPMARSANRKALDQATGHPLVGLRLVLIL
jgi:formylglycine-generating enzyme required for sulfatase activity